MASASDYHERLPGGVQLLRWPHARPLPEREVVAFFEARGQDYHRWSNGAGERYAVHDHAYRKTLFGGAGAVTLSLPDPAREIASTPGDRLILPAGTRHGAVVGPAGVTAIEAGELPW